jgi:hypothetical protein
MPLVEKVGREPGEVREDDPGPSQSYLFDPVTTMLGTRKTRGELALVRARAAFLYEDHSGFEEREEDFAFSTGVDDAYFPHQLPIPDLALPLGWKLSDRAARAILAVSATPEACDRPQSERPTPIEEATQDNACVIHSLGALLDPNADPNSFGLPNEG